MGINKGEEHMIAIAHSLADSVRKFLSKLFNRFRPPAVIPQVPKTELPRKQRTYNKEKTKTFSDLLDNLEYTFDSVKLPTMKESWLERDSVVGLKKLGVHVPNPWNLHTNNADVKVDVTKPLPAIMCISTATVNTVNTKKYMHPKIIFAVKLKKLPWQVARKTGTPYQFGMAFDIEEKLFWIHMYITVNKSTGEIQFCDELKVTAHKINREKTFYNKAWGTSSYLEDAMRTVEERKHIAKNTFVSMHDWWSERDARWNVVVKKNGDRVTFGVDNSQTPYYFKDRDKSIKTATGQTKKIVHYVKEHDRKVNDKTTVVKEHIRGLQEFNWASYHCQVVSPKFQAQTSATFTVPGDDDLGSSNVIYLSKVGKMLADAEEAPRLKERNA
jgi:hypothetical protein